MKKVLLRIIELTLCLPILFLMGCGGDTAPSTPSGSEDETPAVERPRGEALTEEELPYESYLYDYGFYSFCDEEFPTLNFDEAKGLYGEKSIAIIGDSISHGTASVLKYNNSWPVLLKNSINKVVGSNNYGYVSIATPKETDCELHDAEIVKGNWSGVPTAPNTPGFGYYYSTDNSGATLAFAVDNRKGSYNRHINGFYVYYRQSSANGSFDITVDGQKVASVAAGGETKDTARTAYIPLPEGTKSEFEICMVKTDDKPVYINGIAYAEADSGVFVHNYSYSGMKLCEANDSLLRELCRANYVIMALGYNDAGSEQSIDTFAYKLSVIVNACKESGATLVVCDFMWPKGTNTSWAQKYKNELFDAAKIAEGYYIDFTDFYKVENGKCLADTAHPKPLGYRLIARKLSYFFGVPFTTDLD